MRSSCFVPPVLALVVSAALSCSGQRTGPDMTPAVVAPRSSAPGSSPASARAGAVQTPGRIQCADQLCDLRDSYCKNEGSGDTVSPRCVPMGPDFDRDRLSPNSMLCDDASDCQTGEVCCQEPVPGGYEVYVCGKPPCGLREVCVEDGACGQGLTCQSSKESPTGASCVSAKRGAQCGRERCSGQTPVCCWDSNAGTGRCVGETEPCSTNDKSKVAYHCSSKADCAGYYCAFQINRTFCVGEGYVFMGVSCMTEADCPPRSPQTGQPYAGCEMESVGSGKCAESEE